MKLLPPPLPAAAAPLDASQARIAEAVAVGDSVVVTGAPGSGKSTLVVELAVQALQSGSYEPAEVLVLAATRRGAAQMRDLVSLRAGRTISAPPVRTADSVAFAILRERAAAMGQPPPKLINGPEQDHILAEVLAAITDGGFSQVELPPELAPEALGLRGFRNELRDLLMRASEHGVTAARLAELAGEHDKPLWRLAAQLYRQYRAVLALSSGGLDAGVRIDPAELVSAAATALQRWSAETSNVAKPVYKLVIVDDYQEATAATARFLSELRADGAQLVLVGDPDVSVQGFRGALPSLLGTASAPEGSAVGAFGLREFALENVWRQTVALREIAARVTNRIPALTGSPARRKAKVATSPVIPQGAPPVILRDSSPVILREVAESRTVGGADRINLDNPVAATRQAELPSEVAATVFPGKAQEAAWIARQLRAEHLLHSTPWDQMAVITRSGAELSALRRELVLDSVPVALLGADLPLQDEPAVAPLLKVLSVAVGDDEVSAELVAGLLGSPLGGLDAIAQRRLQRSLRARERSDGGGRSSDELLVALLKSALGSNVSVADFAWRERWLSDQHHLGASIEAGVIRVLQAVAAGSLAAQQAEHDITTVLWAVWDATGLAETWRTTALAGGNAGANADRDLDAVMSLFRRAEFFAERNPGAGVDRFVADLMSQDIAADSVAAQGSDQGAVAAVTPAVAAGREWDVVVVAGVQDGSWPDLRLRDTVLGAGELVDIVTGRGEDVLGEERALAARAEVLADETRAFLVATSRARRRLIVTAVESDDFAPSQFLNLVAEPARISDIGAAADNDLELPFDFRGLVTAARLAVTTGGPAADAAANLLAELWEAGVPGADPAEWYGANEASTGAPLWGEDEKLRVSPSKVETIQKCPLKWAFESAGAVAGAALHQDVGNLIHEIAADLPSGSLLELRAELERQWPRLGMQPGWLERQQRSKAEDMLARLAAYYGELPPETKVYSEIDFRFEVGNAIVSGRVDRIEHRPDEKYRIVDFKTGTTVPTYAEMEEHAQLSIYQLALNSGAFRDIPGAPQSDGGDLLFLGKEAKGLPTTRSSAKLDEQRAAQTKELLVETADIMAAAEFAAKTNPLCRTCPLKLACPLQATGKQVI